MSKKSRSFGDGAFVTFTPSIVLYIINDPGAVSYGYCGGGFHM